MLRTLYLTLYCSRVGPETPFQQVLQPAFMSPHTTSSHDLDDPVLLFLSHLALRLPSRHRGSLPFRPSSQPPPRPRGPSTAKARPRPSTLPAISTCLQSMPRAAGDTNPAEEHDRHDNLAAIESTSATFQAAAVSSGVPMPASFELDTTHLTGAFVNKEYRVHARFGRAWVHKRICGLTHAQDGTEVVVARCRDGAHVIESIADVRAALGNEAERRVYDQELNVLTLRTRLRNHAVSYAVAQPDLARLRMPAQRGGYTPLQQVRLNARTHAYLLLHVSVCTRMHTRVHGPLCTKLTFCARACARPHSPRAGDSTPQDAPLAIRATRAAMGGHRRSASPRVLLRNTSRATAQCACTRGCPRWARAQRRRHLRVLERRVPERRVHRCRKARR